MAGEAITDPVLRITNPPPEHQIMLFGLPDSTTGVIFTVFGELRYFVRLGPGSSTTPGVYLLDPLGRTHDWLDWPAWESQLASRVRAANVS